jgi:hypothetical protein
MQIYKLTNAQKVLAAAVLAAAGCASFLMIMQAPQMALKGAHLSTAESIPVSQSSPTNRVAAISTVTTSGVTTGVAMPQVSASNLPTLQTAAQPSWQMGSVTSATPKIPLSEKITDYAIVELEQHPAQLPAVGEQIKLSMLNGQQLVADVQSTTTNPNGDYTWSGHLQGYGTDYPVVMTYGERSIFATITTPEGSYTMESLDGLGWLYKNPAEIELSNPGAKDFLDVTQAH